MVRVAIFAFGLIASFSCGCGTKENREDKASPTTASGPPGKSDVVDSKEVKPDFSMTVEAFAKEVAADETEADKKFAKKILELSGEVYDANVRGDKSVAVIFKQKGGPYIECGLLPIHDVAGLLLSPKQKVKVAGKVTLVSKHTVILYRCSLEELTKSDLLQIASEELAKSFTTNPEAEKKKYTSGIRAIVTGHVENLTNDKTEQLLTLKGDGKTRVIVRVPQFRHVDLNKGQRVRVRAYFDDPPFENAEVKMNHCGILEAK